MKLIKNTYIILFLIPILSLYAQEKRVLLEGIVQNDSIPIENVHILNISSRRGSLSGKNGLFKISCKENDTVIFSDIQYITKKIIINRSQINSEKIVVILKTRDNELNEVVLHTLNTAQRLGLPNAGKKPLTPVQRKLNYIQKGGIIDKVYAMISGKKKKLKKLQKLIEEERREIRISIDVEMIRNHFHESFFIQKAGIPKEEINNFIRYCFRKDLLYFYRKNRDLEMIDIFLKESESFMSNR